MANLQARKNLEHSRLERILFVHKRHETVIFPTISQAHDNRTTILRRPIARALFEHAHGGFCRYHVEAVPETTGARTVTYSSLHKRIKL